MQVGGPAEAQRPGDVREVTKPAMGQHCGDHLVALGVTVGGPAYTSGSLLNASAAGALGAKPGRYEEHKTIYRRVRACTGPPPADGVTHGGTGSSADGVSWMQWPPVPVLSGVGQCSRCHSVATIRCVCDAAFCDRCFLIYSTAVVTNARTRRMCPECLGHPVLDHEGGHERGEHIEVFWGDHFPVPGQCGTCSGPQPLRCLCGALTCTDCVLDAGNEVMHEEWSTWSCPQCQQHPLVLTTRDFYTDSGSSGGSTATPSDSGSVHGVGDELGLLQCSVSWAGLPPHTDIADVDSGQGALNVDPETMDYMPNTAWQCKWPTDVCAMMEELHMQLNAFKNTDAFGGLAHETCFDIQVLHKWIQHGLRGELMHGPLLGWAKMKGHHLYMAEQDGLEFCMSRVPGASFDQYPFVEHSHDVCVAIKRCLVQGGFWLSTSQRLPTLAQLPAR